jgi:hypothetical protein
MSRITIAWIVGCALLFTLTACGQNSIINRWAMAGTLQHGKVVPRARDMEEYEFLKDGTFNAYKRNSLTASEKYVMAPDKKSLVIKHGSESLSVKIIKLTGSELWMIFDDFNTRFDTVVCYPAGSAAAKKILAEAGFKNEAGRYWAGYMIECQNRSDLIGNLIQTIKSRVKDDNEALTQISATRHEISSFDISVDNLSPESLKQFEGLQARFAQDIAALLEFAKKYPDVTASQIYYTLTNQLNRINENIEDARKKLLQCVDKYFPGSSATILAQQKVIIKEEMASAWKNYTMDCVVRYLLTDNLIDTIKSLTGEYGEPAQKIQATMRAIGGVDPNVETDAKKI